MQLLGARVSAAAAAASTQKSQIQKQFSIAHNNDRVYDSVEFDTTAVCAAREKSEVVSVIFTCLSRMMSGLTRARERRPPALDGGRTTTLAAALGGRADGTGPAM